MCLQCLDPKPTFRQLLKYEELVFGVLVFNCCLLKKSQVLHFTQLTLHLLFVK
jgi:hypothetical protein